MHATLQPALSVRPSVRPSICPSIHPSLRVGLVYSGVRVFMSKIVERQLKQTVKQGKSGKGTASESYYLLIKVMNE